MLLMLNIIRKLRFSNTGANMHVIIFESSVKLDLCDNIHKKSERNFLTEIIFKPSSCNIQI